MKRILIAATVLTGGAGMAPAQDIEAGATAFRNCAPCHEIGETAKNRIGPSLNGLDGRRSGSVPDYDYSEANKNSGIVWNAAQFLDYIRDPRTKVPRNRMLFPGIKNESEAQNLWAYVRQFGADGKVK